MIKNGHGINRFSWVRAFAHYLLPLFIWLFTLCLIFLIWQLQFERIRATVTNANVYINIYKGISSKHISLTYQYSIENKKSYGEATINKNYINNDYRFNQRIFMNPDDLAKSLVENREVEVYVSKIWHEKSQAELLTFRWLWVGWIGLLVAIPVARLVKYFNKSRLRL